MGPLRAMGTASFKRNGQTKQNVMFWQCRSQHMAEAAVAHGAIVSADRLVPIQFGILYGCLADASNTVYLGQWCGAVDGRIDLPVLEHAWRERLVARHQHPAWTAFDWQLKAASRCRSCCARSRPGLRSSTWRRVRPPRSTSPRSMTSASRRSWPRTSRGAASTDPAAADAAVACCGSPPTATCWSGPDII